MRPSNASSPPRYGSHGQRLLSSKERRRRRSEGVKKHAVLKYIKWDKPVPPSLAPYAAYYTGSSSSGAGPSRRRPPSPPPTSSDESYSSSYRDYATPGDSDSSDESDGDKPVARDFVSSDKAEQHAIAQLRRRSECAHFHVVGREEREMEEALRASLAPASGGARGGRHRL